MRWLLTRALALGLLVVVGLGAALWVRVNAESAAISRFDAMIAGGGTAAVTAIYFDGAEPDAAAAALTTREGLRRLNRAISGRTSEQPIDPMELWPTLVATRRCRFEIEGRTVHGSLAFIQDSELVGLDYHHTVLPWIERYPVVLRLPPVDRRRR